MAQRYSTVPSYREALAREAVAAAETAAEAAVEAHAAAEKLLHHLETEHAAKELPEAQGDVFSDPFFAGAEAPAAVEAAPRSVFVPAPVVAATVEHHAPLPERTILPSKQASRSLVATFTDAFAEALVPAAQSLPAKLIEFPRELIAPRKQRPRLAEGPLLEEQEAPLRIFEVAPEAPPSSPGYPASMSETSYASEPIADVRIQSSYRVTMQGDRDEQEEVVPRRRAGFHLGGETPRGKEESGWGSIRLGEHPQAEAADVSAPAAARRPENGYQAEARPALHELAPISARSMAALIDGGIVLACCLLSVLVFVSCTVQAPSGKSALAFSLLVFGLLATFYGWLFMTYGQGSTPGMRYARIALCTFSDENPTRKDLQNRVPATALALLPLGLGVLWALLDEDKLGWHDRMTRTYQRRYK